MYWTGSRHAPLLNMPLSAPISLFQRQGEQKFPRKLANLWHSIERQEMLSKAGIILARSMELNQNDIVGSARDDADSKLPAVLRYVYG